MNIRVKLAKWLAPELETEHRNLRWYAAAKDSGMTIMAERSEKLANTLKRIKACNTPNASHTVKKIVAMAEEALR